MPEHEFLASHLENAEFAVGELRSYFLDRDTGVAAATGGAVTALVHRANGPCPPGPLEMHYHDVAFQMNYVLKGKCRFFFEDEGEVEFAAGDVWVQPPRIRHQVLWFSDDFEVLEIVMPGQFETVDV